MVNFVFDVVEDLVVNPLRWVGAALLSAFLFVVAFQMVGVGSVQAGSLAALTAVGLSVVGLVANRVVPDFRVSLGLPLVTALGTTGLLAVLAQLGHGVHVGDVLLGIVVSTVVLLAGSATDTFPAWLRTVVGWAVGGGLLSAALYLVVFPLGVWSLLIVAVGVVVALVMYSHSGTLTNALFASLLVVYVLVMVFDLGNWANIGLSHVDFVRVFNVDGVSLDSVGSVWALVFVGGLVIVTDHLNRVLRGVADRGSDSEVFSCVVALIFLGAMFLTSVLVSMPYLVVASILGAVGVLAVRPCSVAPPAS